MFQAPDAEGRGRIKCRLEKGQVFFGGGEDFSRRIEIAIRGIGVSARLAARRGIPPAAGAIVSPSLRGQMEHCRERAAVCSCLPVGSTVFGVVYCGNNYAINPYKVDCIAFSNCICNMRDFIVLLVYLLLLPRVFGGSVFVSGTYAGDIRL